MSADERRAQRREHIDAAVESIRRQDVIDVLRAAIDAAHEEQRQVLALGREGEAMTLFQHWSATAGWLAARIRAIERTGEPDWPDAMCHVTDASHLQMEGDE